LFIILSSQKSNNIYFINFFQIYITIKYLIAHTILIIKVLLSFENNIIIIGKNQYNHWIISRIQFLQEEKEVGTIRDKKAVRDKQVQNKRIWRGL